MTTELLTDELHAELVGQIAAAADGDWRAAAWLLEHGWPDQWRLRPLNGKRDPDADKNPTTASTTSPADPFNEVDELAAKRQRTTN